MKWLAILVCAVLLFVGCGDTTGSSSLHDVSSAAIPGTSLPQSNAVSTDNSTGSFTGLEDTLIPEEGVVSVSPDEFVRQPYCYVMKEEDMPRIISVGVNLLGLDFLHVIQTMEPDDEMGFWFNFISSFAIPYESRYVSSQYMSQFSQYVFGKDTMQIGFFRKYGPDDIVDLHDLGGIDILEGYIVRKEKVELVKDEKENTICLYNVLFSEGPEYEPEFVGSFAAYFLLLDDNGTPYTKLDRIEAR